jgi:hypothetical protein
MLLLVIFTYSFAGLGEGVLGALVLGDDSPSSHDTIVTSNAAKERGSFSNRSFINSGFGNFR